MRIIIVVALLALCGCAAVNQQNVKKYLDFGYCYNIVDATKIFKGSYPGEYYNSNIYSCEPVIEANKGLKVFQMYIPPADAKLVGGQVVVTLKANAPVNNNEYSSIMTEKAKFIGGNLLVENPEEYKKSPETHYYRVYYSPSNRVEEK